MKENRTTVAKIQFYLCEERNDGRKSFYSLVLPYDHVQDETYEPLALARLMPLESIKGTCIFSERPDMRCDVLPCGAISWHQHQ